MRSDISNYDGTLATSRTDSSGGTTSGLKVGDAIDVLSVFGSGDPDNMTDTTISLAISTLGSANRALSFAPGTWTISNSITIASNFTVVCPAGCVFSVASTKTMTVAGVFVRQHATYSAGAGTLTVSGTDVLATSSAATQYAVDTGSADVYVIAPSPAIASYSAGQYFAFKAANTNTGASTLNVNAKGAKDIVDGAGTALSAGAITANGVYNVRYDGTKMYLTSTQVSTEVSTDTSPQLGGALDTNAFSINESEGTSVTAAATTNIWVTDGNTVHVTGSTGISSFSTAPRVGARRRVVFDGAPLLTHGTNLNLPGSVDYQVVAGDIIDVYADTTTQFDVVVHKQSIAGGKTVVYDNGTKSTGTFTPNPTLGATQIYVNGGAHTLAPPTVTGHIWMTVTNNASAGAVTTSGYTSVTGGFTTTNTSKFLCEIYYDGTNSTLKIMPMQLGSPTTLVAEQSTAAGNATPIDFTGIPAGVREIVIMFVGASASGTSEWLIQIGDAGGFETTSYVSTATKIDSSPDSATSTAGFILQSAPTAANIHDGRVTLSLQKSSTFMWVSSGVIDDGVKNFVSSGHKALSAELTQVRLTTVGGTDNWDAGVVSIAYRF